MNATARIVHALVAGQTFETSDHVSSVDQSVLHELHTFLHMEPRDLSHKMMDLKGWTIGASSDTPLNTNQEDIASNPIG
jgi:hypothetical protein